MESGKEIYIKNMVCDRCVMAVTDVLERLGLTPATVTLGRAEFPQPLTAEQRQALRHALDGLGFELIDDQRIRTAERIKQLLIGLTRQSGKRPKTNLSHYLAEQCCHDYSALSRLFSETQGTTIEKYLQTYLVDLYQEMVPEDQVKEIEAIIHQENLEDQREREARKVFSAFRLLENGNARCLATESSKEFLDAARLLRKYLQDGAGGAEDFVRKIQ